MRMMMHIFAIKSHEFLNSKNVLHYVVLSRLEYLPDLESRTHGLLNPVAVATENNANHTWLLTANIFKP